MDVNTETEAGQIAALTQAAMSPTVMPTADGRVFLIAPKEAVVKEITDPHNLVLTPPGRVVQSVEVQTLDSLVEYVNRFKTPDTILLADIANNRIVGLLDYHHKADAAGLSQADHVDHIVYLQLPFAVEWGIWLGAHDKLKDQQDFAQFIEENAADVEAPDAMSLLEVAQDIRMVRNADFRRSVRASGEAERFEFTESEGVTSGAGLEVPARLKLSLPVYFGHRHTNLFAFLRFKKVGTALHLGIALNRHEVVRQAIFKEIVMDAGDRTNCPALFGRLDD